MILIKWKCQLITVYIAKEISLNIFILLFQV